VPVGPPRRAVLAASAAAAGLLVTGCKGIQVLGTPPPPAPDIRTLQAAIAAEQLMVSRYHAAIRRADGAGGQAAIAALTGLLAEHEQHLAQLTARLIEPSGRRPSPAPAAGSAEPIALPAGLAAAIGALAADEQAASARLAGQLQAAPPALAQLFASISASEATHVPVLSALGRAG
jgi:hypothetical protein